METYTKSEAESIDDTLIQEALKDEELIQVSKEQDYLQAMEDQNKKIVEYLSEKYPERYFRVGKWNAHDFGAYQEVEEITQRTYCEGCDNLADECECED